MILDALRETLIAKKKGRNRKCLKCLRSKPYADFPLNSNGKDFSTVCLQCVSDRCKQPSAALLALTFQFDKQLDRKVDKRFASTVMKRMHLYKCDALDALHDMAMMDVTEKPLLAQWKFQAAQLLATGLNAETGSPTNSMAEVLAALNKSYTENAPRIKAIRERVVEFEAGRLIEAD